MLLNRRTLAIASLGIPLAHKDWATPTDEASPEVLTPEQTLEALLASPFLSPLLPADTGEVIVAEWIDDSDDDLVNAVGGVIFVTQNDVNIGAMIVYPDMEAARARIDVKEPSTTGNSELKPIALGGGSGLTYVEAASGSDDIEWNYATSAIAIDTVIISGGSEGLPANELESRSLAHLVALIDHYRRIVAQA